MEINIIDSAYRKDIDNIVDISLICIDNRDVLILPISLTSLIDRYGYKRNYWRGYFRYPLSNIGNTDGELEKSKTRIDRFLREAQLLA